MSQVPNPAWLETATTLGGLTIWDMGWKENIVRLGTSTATRQIACFCTQRELVYEYLLSGYVVQGGRVVQSLSAYPDIPWMYVDEIESVPHPDANGTFVGSNGQFEEEYAFLNVKYKAYQWAGGQQGYITFRYGSAVLAMPNDGTGNTGMKWASDSTAVPAQSAPPLRYMLVGITCHLVNQPPVANSTIQTLIDNINSDTFFGYGAGQVRFLGCSTELSASGYNPQGQGFTEGQNWEFEARSFSWNKLLRPSLMSGAASVLQALDSTNPPIFGTTAFSPLFPLAAG